jgi:hypothetical protein
MCSTMSEFCRAEQPWLGRDFRAIGQTLASIGLGDLTVPELKKFVEEG